MTTRSVAFPGNSSSGIGFAALFGVLPVAALALPPEDIVVPHTPSLQIELKQTMQSDIVNARASASLDHQLRASAASAFSSLLEAQTEIEPDIAEIVYRKRSELYAVF